MTISSPFKLKVKTVTIEYDAAATLGPRLDIPETAAAYITTWNTTNANPPDLESFTVLGLDSQHHLTSAETLTRGTKNQAPVDAQRLFRHLVAVDASGFIITHNHPSGNLEPSHDDYTLTRRLARGGAVIGIACLDHIITTPDGRWTSLRATRCDLFTATL